MNNQDINAPSFWGQLLMVGLPGLRMDAVAREMVRDLQVGGVILFARNIESPEQVWQLCRDLQQEAMAASGLPLLISVDQEGGPVQRFKAPFTIIPPARQLGLEATAKPVETLARQTARELSLVGVNMDLAPVLDVARGPDCPLWERSYGPDPELVAQLGAAAIRGYLAGGVFPVGKHFPGLGDTRVDSHVDLPLTQAGDSARETDMIPFRAAVAAGVPAIMTAHVVVPAWDSRAATLSAIILQEKLRRDLGFEGVIITDDLEMGAIATQQTASAGAREALAAGADLLLICNNWEAIRETVRLLQGNAALASLAEAAARRVRLLRQRISLPSADLQEVKEYFRRPRD
ncbi:MAG: beta-N-acetylhexosaminidase [Desulfobaccales bacterium]